jgi:hypothetical protein
MRFGLSSKLSLSAVFLAALAAAFRGEAQTHLLYDGRPIETQPLTLDLNDAWVGAYGELFDENVTYTQGAPLNQRRYFVGPTAGMDISGAIYHPNLADYRVKVELMGGYEKDSYTGPNSHLREGLDGIGSLDARLGLLDSKPLHGNAFINYGKTYQDYDFYDRIYMDALRFGGAAFYTSGPWSLSAGATHDTEDATGYGTPTSSERTTVTTGLDHTRASGSTSLTYNFSHYSRNDYGSQGYGDDHTVSASDLETFGSRGQFTSRANVTYNRLDDLVAPRDLLTASDSLTGHYTERLSSDHLLNYSRNQADGSLNESISGNSDLQYRLYDSLVSSLEAQGYRSTASDHSSSQRSWQFGGGPGFNYTKRVGSRSTLTAYDSLTVLHTEIEGNTGLILPAIEESHTFGSGGAPADAFFLDHPNVTTVTIVRDNVSGTVYQEGLHYTVEQNGNRTLIRRVSGMGVASTVTVTYYYESETGSYNSLNNAFGIRLDLMDNLWGLYLRLGTVRNSGAASSMVQDLNDLVSGTDLMWHNLRGSAEYENYDSSLAPFSAWRFSQGATFHLDGSASLSLTLSESLMHFQRPERNEKFYSAMASYSQNLTRTISLSLQGGISQRQGPGVDQTLVVVRPSLQYVEGKFSASIGYEYGYNEYLSSEKRERNMGFVRFRKSF